MDEMVALQIATCRECGDALTVWESEGVCILCED